MNIVLFSSLLLPPSQTFIRAQGEEIQQFTPYYVGSRLVPGLDLPPERTIVVNRGGKAGNAAEGLFKLSGVAPQFYQQVRQLNPGLIHAQFGLSGALALPLARSLKVPLLVHFRGADATIKDEHARYSSLNHWIYLRRRDTLKREARLFITVSKFIKEKLLEQGFPPNKIIVHYSGINTAAFTPDPTLPRESTVLFVGRLMEKKGCEYLIQAMAKIQAERPDVELVMIGDGPLRSSLEASAAKLLRRYQFLGVQPSSVVQQWMNRARLLAAPSVTASQGDSEGLPNVVLEAQAMGLPVVSTLHAGVPEGVIQGETGFLAAERNVEELANYCLRVLQDNELWRFLSTNGQEHVRTHFDRPKQTRILEGIYQAVLRGEM
ncbi:glycosyltransferase [Oculatella sp. LEGE 06141]|uniref:glycosyltransferase n=1 Tax=Oculatella sp. LEGE 06141 TaxID=1828648 RepID=UPI001880FCCA|nr:glycosyltransferase [Oculatella sp. LEGE 06141]MBE9178841.1 glycosyltransferase [Oculatella sp. LEGE 06141]